MVTRFGMDWDAIICDVLSSVDAVYPDKPFVNCWTIAEHVVEQKRPTFLGITDRVARGRVSIALGNKLGWRRFNRIHGKRAPVFIDPRKEA